MIDATALLDRLTRWRSAGALRALDLAFVRWLHASAPATPPSLLLAAALLARLEGEGHTALPLDDRGAAEAALGPPPPGEAGWFAALPSAGPAAWPADAAARRAAWGGCPAVEIDPATDGGTTPLVVDGPLLHLRRHWRDETAVAAQLGARAAAPLAAAAPPAATVRAWLDRLFPAAAAAPGGEPDWQKLACALAVGRRLTLVTGGPGTGKTYTAARLLVLLQALHEVAAPDGAPLRVALCAPTGKAAARLRQSIGDALAALRGPLGADLPAALAAPADPAEPAAATDPLAELPPARTLHALLGTRPGTRRFRHDAAHPLELDLLFVDEASMVHAELMARLLEALPPTARLVLLGDRDQLASVEAGAVFGALCEGAGRGYREETVAAAEALAGIALPPSTRGAGSALQQGSVRLVASRRFDGPIGQLARAVNAGDAAALPALLPAEGDGPVRALRRASAAGVVELAVQGRALAGEGGAAAGPAPGFAALYAELAAGPPADPAGFQAWALARLAQLDSVRVLTALRDGPWGVAGLNAAIERALAALGLLNPENEWYVGRPLMVTRNDPSAGVFNGDVGLVLRRPDGLLRACFADGGRLHALAPTRLPAAETAFAMTVHKSQGSEFAHVILVLPEADNPVLTREWLYTGLTRARRAFTLAGADLSLAAVAAGRPTLRIGGLAARLG